MPVEPGKEILGDELWHVPSRRRMGCPEPGGIGHGEQWTDRYSGGCTEGTVVRNGLGRGRRGSSRSSNHR